MSFSAGCTNVFGAKSLIWSFCITQLAVQVVVQIVGAEYSFQLAVQRAFVQIVEAAIIS